MSFAVPIILAIGSQNSAGAAPTGVSIATTSSGNYDNAIATAEVQLAGFVDVHDFLHNGSFNFSSALGGYTMTKNVTIGDFDGFNGNASLSEIAFRAYCRATDATSFSWAVSIEADSCTGVTNSMTTSSSTAQDGTSGNGVGKAKMVFGGGRGGFTFPSNGESLTFKVECTASNSSGNTDAAPIYIKFAYFT